MQIAAPKSMDISKEPSHILKMYGAVPNRRGAKETATDPRLVASASNPTFANNCLLARRLVARGVRFVQLYMRGWDQHGNLPGDMRKQSLAVDRAQAALVADLRQRGLRDDTLGLWAGEVGRTVYSQGTLSATNYGRDHHPRCFSLWMAGGGVKGSVVYGETDDFSYNIVKDPVHVRDLNATILHLLGIDHQRLTYKFQGLDQRLTGVEESKLIKPVLA